MTTASHLSKKLFGLILVSFITTPAVAVEATLEPVPTSKVDSAPLAVSQGMRQAAVDFLDSLSQELRDEATFPFESKQRTDWHFVPKPRSGVSLKEMTPAQRRAAQSLMRSILSEKGHLKATTIMSLERVLRLIEAGKPNVLERRDPQKYWFAVFGDPAPGKPWGWRVEGHHLSLNFTSVDGKVASVTPLFFGSNPAEVNVGPRIGLRVLGDEIDQARQLMATLSAEQLSIAVISDQAPADVLTVPGKPVPSVVREGLAAGDMEPAQQQQLSAMVKSFVHHLRPAIAEQELEAIEAEGSKEIYFAWAGSLNPKEKHYFRIHGPTFLLEYDNAQGNHAHLVWHSTDNDFGAATLRDHYHAYPHQ